MTDNRQIPGFFFPAGRSALALAVVLIWCFFSTVFAQEKPVPVSTSLVKSGQTNEQLPLTGTVTSPRSSSISTKVEGYIDRILVEVGDVVNKGDVLLELDKELAEIEQQRIRAMINEAVTREKELIRQRDEAEELMSQRHVSETTFKAARAEVDINATVIERLRVELKRQAAIVKRHIVKAPFNGIITERMIEMGQWIETNDALIELTEMNPLRIEVPVPQYYFNRIQTGTPVSIRYDALPDKQFVAKVNIKVPLSQQSARTFPIMINIDNSDYSIAPGMSARVYFNLPEDNETQALLIPRDAVVKKTDGSEKVWVVTTETGNTIAMPIEVTTGRSQADVIQVIQGDLKVGDQIVVKGNEILQPGQEVNIVEQLDYTL